MIINIKFNKKSIPVPIRKLSSFGRIKGLMFKSNKENLLFDFKEDTRMAIHSFFVFFPFLAVWLDKSNRILEWKLVNPFRLCVVPKRKFRKLIEIPIAECNRKIIDFIVGKRETFK